MSLAAVLLVLLGLVGSARAADAKEGTAAIDKAIKAMGGQEKLAAMKGGVLKIKGKVTINGEADDFTMAITYQGLDHARQEFAGNIGGNDVKHLLVLAGEKGWQRGGEDVTELDEAAMSGFRRNLYVQIVAINPTLLKDKGFKIDSATDDADGKHVNVKVIGPDEKDFTIAFDKETGLPSKLTAKVMNYRGEEVTQETTYSDYKETDGIKSASKAVVSHNGEKLMDEQSRDLKVMEKADDAAFAEPK